LVFQAYSIKCNIDGAALGCPCGGIFRDSSTANLHCFVINLGVTYVFHYEFIGDMVIEISNMKGRPLLRVETNSLLVTS
jgi:hypothetical protein